MKNKRVLSIALSMAILGVSNSIFAEETTPTESKEAAPATEVVDKNKVAENPAATTDTEQVATTSSTKSPEVKAKPMVTKKTMPSIPFTGVSSLRGNNAIKEEAQKASVKQLPADRAPIMRNYFQQPPLIPHRVREYRITVNNNKCLSCHSWKNAKTYGATKISQTHFADRDGNAHSTVAARRYFCNQCHVPQVDAKPLVDNLFKPVSELK